MKGIKRVKKVMKKINSILWEKEISALQSRMMAKQSKRHLKLTT